MQMRTTSLAALLSVMAMSAHADSFVLNGSLTDADPTFNRPVTLTLLSGVGTAVAYDAFSFIGVTPNEYTFTMQASAGASFDTFLLLYAGPFDPASPLSNLVALNDDFGGSISTSSFNYALGAGQQYTVVSTAFSNAGRGDFTTTVTVVPEPGSYALMGAGVLALGAWMRRRQVRA